MPSPLSKAEIARRVEAIHEALRSGHKPDVAPRIAGLALGMTSNSFRNWLCDALERGQVKVDWSLYRAPEPVKPKIEPAAPPPDGPSAPAGKPGIIIEDTLIGMLRKAPMTLDEIAGKFGVTKGQALDAVDGMSATGINVKQLGDRWSIEKTAEPAYIGGHAHEFVSDADNTFRFGVMADSHLGSKYERLDALNDSYDRFEREGISRVYHCGNWIEGEARFNRTDLAVHGMDEQLAYLAARYPSRPGITTYAVAGDDHEGWYAQREGIDIGRRAEQTMRENGRTDWVNLGFMEAHIKLVNANTGKSAILAVVHPGGGSSYAESYVVQKIIESLDGGEKPAVALYGHYHKCLSGNYRNVWWVLVPSTKDQDVFMRKKRLRSVVGGGIVELEQDPETGAIIGMTPKLWQYFNKGYYDGRWSHSGPVTLPERAP